MFLSHTFFCSICGSAEYMRCNLILVAPYCTILTDDIKRLQVNRHAWQMHIFSIQLLSIYRGLVQSSICYAVVFQEGSTIVYADDWHQHPSIERKDQCFCTIITLIRSIITPDLYELRGSQIAVFCPNTNRPVELRCSTGETGVSGRGSMFLVNLQMPTITPSFLTL